MLVAVDSRPIADDWWFITGAQHWSFIRYMTDNLGASGRFSQFALTWFSVRLFGVTAINIVPLLLLSLACASGTSLLHRVSAMLNAPIGWIESTLVALLILVSAVATAPSLYDTEAWFAADVAYLAGVAAALATAALCVRQLTSRSPGSPAGAVGLGLLAGVAGGFHELIGVTVALAGVMGILTVRDLRGDAARTQIMVPLTAIALGAAIGTAGNVLSPGAQSRAQAQGAHLSISAAVRTALNNLSFLRADVHEGVLLLAVAAGLVIWQVVGPIRGRRERRWLGAWVVFLLIVPWLVTAALTAWAGSTESGDRSPFRAAFVGTGSTSLAVVLCVCLLLSTFPAFLSQGRATLLALLLAAAGTIAVAHKADPILQAESMRAAALDARASSIRRQLTASQASIVLLPAPLLTVSTQALDLSFAPTDQQPRGWITAVDAFYGIPRSREVRVVARQPRGYCLPGVSAPWVGVQSCQQLHAHG